MSEITITKWKEVKNEGRDFYFINPAFTENYWKVCRWWYKGKQSPYVNCSRVDFKGYQIYINGTTPLMNLRIQWDGKDMRLFDPVDIQRILICRDLVAVNRRETTDYMDIWYNKSYPKFEVIFDDLEIDIPIDDSAVITVNPKWDELNTYSVNSTITAYTGDYVGGVPPIETRSRFQRKTQGQSAWIDEPWELNKLPESPCYFTIPAFTSHVRFQYQVIETEENRIIDAFTPDQGVGAPPLPDTCTPLDLLPDLGAAVQGQRVCYDGDVIIVEDLPALPS